MLGALPLPLIGLMLFAGMVAANELGHRLHRLLRGRAKGEVPGSTEEGFILSGMLGLLSLLLAFSFGLALDRHEQRRALIVAEANAVDGFAQHLALLEPDAAAPVRAELRAYARTRLMAGVSEISEASRRAEVLRVRLGEATLAAMRGAPPSAVTSLVAQGLDTLGDVAAERRALAVARMPGLVLTLLALYCLVAALMLGYSVAAANSRHRVASSLWFMLLAFAFATILDLDRPRGGAIRVPLDPLAASVARLG